MLVAGFGQACELARHDGEADRRRMALLTNRLKLRLEEVCARVIFFGSLNQRIPGNLCFGFPGITARELISAVQHRVAVSSGSACSSNTESPSRVLLALNYTPAVAMTGVRVSLGRFTTDSDISVAMDAFSAVAPRIESA